MARIVAPRPLAATDDRESFDCGRSSLNQWFRRNAWRNQEFGVTRTNVICDQLNGTIAGYVSLSTAQIAREYLPKSLQRNQPDPLPAILLGQLAIDLRYQGLGYSASLMRFAFSTACRLSRDIGCFGVVTHPLDDEVRNFYRRFGFEDLPFDPRRAMVVRIVDLVKNGF